MAPPNIAVYTSHEIKEILTSEANGTDKETVDTTVVKAWMRNEKKISGMILKANLHNATFPSYDLWRQYDTVPNTSFVTGFDTTFLMDNGWDSTRFTFNSATNKMLFFDTLTNAIGDYSTGNVISKGDVANYKGSFNIDSISVANSYGNLISSITDVFTHMRNNDYSSIFETGKFEQADVQRESNLITPITGDGDLQKPTSAVINGENEASGNTPGLSLFTTNWGPGGFILKELYLVQDSSDNVLAQASLNGVTLEGLEYTQSSGKSVWNSTGYNQAGNAQIAMKATIDDSSTPVVDGHTNSGTAAFYIQFSNTNNSSSEAKGDFIVKASTSVVPGHNTNFGENKLIGVSLILPNLGSSLSVSEQSVSDGDAVKYGAKLKLQFNVSGQNALYKMDGKKIVASGTGHKEHIYVTNVYRERTDTGVNGKEYGVLYGEENVTLIPDGTKVVTSDSDKLELVDQYGLYHNATYKYYGTVTSALTGETISVHQSRHTKPGICRNLEDYPTTTASGIYAIWENAKATGNYQSLNYKFEVKQIKFDVKAYNRDGTVETDATVDEVSVAYNYQDTGISTTSHNILGTFLPGISDKVTARVQAYNNQGASSWLSSSVLSVVESVDLAQATLTGVEIRVAQNPIAVDLDNGLPALGGDITTLDGYATKSIEKDSFNKQATYETNFVELIVPAEQETIASYLVYVQGRFYGEVPKGDLTDRKIIVAGKKSDSSNENKYNLEIDTTYSFAVIAKYNDGTYSRTPSFNFSVTMYPKAAYPPPTPVDNLTVSSSGVYNALNISCDIPANSFIAKLELYQVVFDGIDYGLDMQSADDSLASTLSPDSAPILHNITESNSATNFTSKVRLLQEKTGIPASASGSTSFNLQRKYKTSSNSQITWGDNMYGAFVCLAYNVDGVRSTDKLPTEKDDSDNWVYDTTATYIFGNTGSNGTAQEQIIAIGKTQPPEQATPVSVSDSKVTSNILLQVGLPSPNYNNYSHDTPLKTKIDVKLTGYGTTTTTTGGTTQIMAERDQSSFAYTYNTNSTNYSGKVCQNTKFDVTAEVSTNMQPTWAPGTDNFVPATKTESITTKAATYQLVGNNDYVITKEYTKNQKPCINVDPYVKSGETVEFLKYPALDSSTQLQGVSITAPPFLYPEWKRDSENPDNPTNFLISGGHNPGLVEGDILFVMNKTNGATLDSLVLTADHIALMNDANQSTNRNPLQVPVLKASKPASRIADTSNASYQFGVWTASTQSIC